MQTRHHTIGQWVAHHWTWLIYAIGLMAVMVAASGCSSASLASAKAGMERADAVQALAFEDVYRTADEQMFLATMQFVQKHHNDLDVLREGLKAAWEARTALQQMREQYTLGRVLNRVTVGTYLYSREDAANKVQPLIDAVLESLKPTTPEEDSP